MDGKNLFYGILVVIAVAFAFNTLLIDMSVTNNLPAQSGLPMERFNKTQEILGDLHDMKNETGFLGPLPIIGDVVAAVGNGLRAMQIIYGAPGMLLDMISVAFGLIGVPSWFWGIISAIIWVTVIWIIINSFLGRKP